MANLTPQEYVKNDYGDFNLIRAIRINSTNSVFKSSVQFFIWIIQTEDKKAKIINLWTDNYEADGTTYKKNANGKYFEIDEDNSIVVIKRKSDAEFNKFILDKEEQNKYINVRLKYNGPWVVTQDPWDSNIIPPKSAPPIILPVKSTDIDPIQPTIVDVSSLPNKYQPTKLQDDFTFDVSKDKTFVISGGNNGNLVLLPDGTKVDLGELTIVKQEDPYDPEIIKILIQELDNGFDDISSEYTEIDYNGLGETSIQIEADSIETINQEYYNAIKGYDPENPDDNLSTDGGSKYPISKDQEKNIKEIIKVAKESGITNGYSIAAMLAICKKESGLVPKGEASYSGTEAYRIKSLFSKFRKYSNDEIDKIKKNNKKFFDIIYGGESGNGADEGYKYRGRGFNQITFKGNYQKFKKLSGYDIVGDPDSLNKVDVAAKCMVEFFKFNFKNASSSNKDRYNFTDINAFKSLNDATGAFYHANAGFGKSYSEIVADSTGGRAKAFDYVGNLYNKYLKDK